MSAKFLSEVETPMEPGSRERRMESRMVLSAAARRPPSQIRRFPSGPPRLPEGRRPAIPHGTGCDDGWALDR